MKAENWTKDRLKIELKPRSKREFRLVVLFQMARGLGFGLPSGSARKMLRNLLMTDHPTEGRLSHISPVL